MVAGATVGNRVGSGVLGEADEDGAWVGEPVIVGMSPLGPKLVGNSVVGSYVVAVALGNEEGCFDTDGEWLGMELGLLETEGRELGCTVGPTLMEGEMVGCKDGFFDRLGVLLDCEDGLLDIDGEMLGNTLGAVDVEG